MSSSLEQHIFVPELFESLNTWHKDFEFIPSSPLLVKHLSKAKKNKQVHSGLLASIYALVGSCANKESASKNNNSHAQACYQYDMGEVAQRDVLCAAPIELEAGMSDIVIGGTVIDDLDQNECQQLAKLLNNHFSQDGWEFVFSNRGEDVVRWYLLLPEKTGPDNTIPLSDALGASLRTLVEGTEDVQWSRQLNELQMLLFSSSTNQQRESSRKRSVSSFWLWDVDVDSKRSLASSVDFVSGGGYEGKVIANAYNLEWCELPSKESGIGLQQRKGSAGLYIYDGLVAPARCNNLSDWQDKVNELEYFLAGLLDNSGMSTTIYSCNGYFWKLGNKDIWGFLRKRKKTLLDFI